MIDFFWIRKKFSWYLLAQLILLTVGIIYTSVNHSHHQQKIDTQITEALAEKLSVLSTGISEKLELSLFNLNAMRGAIHGVGIERLNYSAIENYSKSIYIQSELTGVNGTGFIKSVSSQAVDDFINDAREERVDRTFNVKSLGENNENKFIIQYIFPEKKNYQALGLDIGSERIRKQAAFLSAINNRAQLTAPITLVQKNEKPQNGFLLLLPVYKTINSPVTENSRMENLVGWVYSPLLINDVLMSLFKKNINHLSISDISKNTSLTFFNDDNKQDLTHYVASETHQVMGRSWRLDLTATTSFIKQLNLAGKYTALLNSLLNTVLVMLIVAFIQLVFHRKKQQAEIEISLAKMQEKVLEEANLQLEVEVKSRTQQLAKINVLHRSILNSASYAVIATDINGLITEFNPAAEQMLGYQAAEIIGIKTPSIFHLASEVVEKAKQLSVELNQPIEPGFEVFVAKATPSKPDIGKWTYLNASGKHIPVKLSVTPLLNSEGETVGYLGISYDLTEQLEYESKLADAKEVAEKASNAKSEFLANMSHEIRTPMNGIFGMLQLLQALPLNTKAHEYLKNALYSTKALSTVINDILDFSKIEAGKLSIEKRTFNLDDLLSAIEAALLSSANDKNITFTVDSKVTHAYWLGDDARLRQCLLNLVSNAIKFTHQGSVMLEVSLSKTDEMCFVVSDTGVGISQEALGRLFQRFEQADTSTTREYGGTGLGLPITHSLIELMGGRIEVISKEKQGSKFIVYLPLIKAEGTLKNSEPQDIEYPNLSGKTILLAEDNKINQLVAKNMLSPSKANISIANNGIEAIDLYKELLPDIIFMDIQMPKMDGMEACLKIKAIAPEQKIVALTANALTEQKQLYDETFDGYLPKPIDQVELIKLLKSMF